MPPAFLALPLLALRLIAAEQHPNFSGHWVQVSRSCRPAAKPGKPVALEVEQTDAALVVHSHSGEGSNLRTLDVTYVAGGAEQHYTGLDGDDFHTRLRWQGTKLVFDILELERGSKIVAQETWELQGDGSKMHRVKREDGPDEHSTCTSDFSKADR